MKKIIVFISLIFISLSGFTQQTIEKNTYLDPKDHIILTMSCTGAKITKVYIDNIDLKGASIPSIEGLDMIYRMNRRKLENHSIINGHSIVEYYTSPYIYEVDGVLLVSEKEKKKLANLDIWDTTYFEVLKPREAKKRFGKVGKKGAVIIKTAKGNYIDGE